MTLPKSVPEAKTSHSSAYPPLSPMTALQALLASIKGSDKPYSIMAQAPLAIIADTDVISKAPWRFVISGCGDVIAKFTAVKDWKLAHIENQRVLWRICSKLSVDEC